MPYGEGLSPEVPGAPTKFGSGLEVIPAGGRISQSTAVTARVAVKSYGMNLVELIGYSSVEAPSGPET
jgi:hypothetical protein